MKVIAGILVALVAAEHLGFLVLEMFLWTTPYALKAFSMSEDSHGHPQCWRQTRASTTASLPPG